MKLLCNNEYCGTRNITSQLKAIRQLFSVDDQLFFFFFHLVLNFSHLGSERVETAQRTFNNKYFPSQKAQKESCHFIFLIQRAALTTNRRISVCGGISS